MRDSVSREGDKLKEELKKEFVSMFGNLASDLMSKERDRFKKEFVSMLQEKLPATLDQYIALKLASINATNSGNISSLFQSLFHAPSNTMSGQVVQENDASDDDPVPNLFFHDSR